MESSQQGGVLAHWPSSTNGAMSTRSASLTPTSSRSPLHPAAVMSRAPSYLPAADQHPYQHHSIESHRKVRKGRASSLRKAALILGSRERERERECERIRSVAAAAAANAWTRDCDCRVDETNAQWGDIPNQLSSAVTAGAVTAGGQSQLLLSDLRNAGNGASEYGRRIRGFSAGASQQPHGSSTPSSFLFSTPPTVTPPLTDLPGPAALLTSDDRSQLRSQSGVPPASATGATCIAATPGFDKLLIVNHDPKHCKPGTNGADQSASFLSDTSELTPGFRVSGERERLLYPHEFHEHEHQYQRRNNQQHHHHHHHHQHHNYSLGLGQHRQQENMPSTSQKCTNFSGNAKSPLSKQIIKDSTDYSTLSGVGTENGQPKDDNAFPCLTSQPKLIERNLHAPSMKKQHTPGTATKKATGSNATFPSAEISHPTSPLALAATTSATLPEAGTAALKDPIGEPWDYTETERWGWFILIMTWIVFVIGMGSCFGVWSWAWDVGETPYAPPELEDDPTLPIVGYYPALIILTAVMAWVWVVIAWVGMKYFRHANIVGEEM
ncbi:hypothetical protein KEM54_002253 [Ascosphaera aggregata]|nr:hypothetical protein KEM54_002253 [Ascosphaera aggregata]